jgi:hypothetical protein
MSDDSIFQYATRNKLRFPSGRGELTVEQLWDVPLRSSNDFNLDVIAKTINKALKEASEESFVNSTRSPAQTRLEIMLQIAKHVIITKLEEERLAEKRAANKKEREKLLEILAEKQEGKLSKLSETELRRRIEALEV